MLKKIRIILIALLLIASLAGCRQPGESSSDSAAEESSAMQSNSSADTTASETAASSKAAASASSKASSEDSLDDTLSMAEDIMSTLSELDDITSSGIVVPNS